MRSTVLEHLDAFASSYLDLAGSLPREAFASRLAQRSNEIGQQFWCVVGARESYARAIRAGAWAGFDCSLPGPATGDGEEVLAALKRSASTVVEAVAEADWNELSEGFLIDLLEHEAQHQGQLIRYIYALGYPVPDSWKHKWALTD